MASGGDHEMKIPIALQLNCGFARVAILEFSRVPKGASRTSLDKSQRCHKFRDHFSSNASFNMPEDYYAHGESVSQHSFHHHCEFVIRCFNKKWYPHAKRKEYLANFSTLAWKSLPQGQQSGHSLSNCRACSEGYYGELQQAFPGLPCYSPPTMLVHIPANEAGKSPREVTRTVLGELNRSYQERYGQTFSDAAVQYCGRSEGIERRKSKQDKKNATRQIQRKCRDSSNEHYASTATLSFLSQNESLASYQRKRLMQSFERLPGSGRKLEKSHIPSKAKHTWNTDAIVEEVRKWPENQRMNWTEVARRHNVPGRNGGQIVKTLAQENGVDVSRFSANPPKKRTRASKCTFPGKEISIPANPTPTAIQEDIRAMIDSGKLSLGEPCVPYTLAHLKVVDGEVVRTSSVVHGRKLPLAELRKKLLDKHEQYMHLFSDDTIDSMPEADLKAFLKQLHECTDGLQVCELRERVRCLQRSRTISLWHDHSSILGCGYVLVTVQVVYDPAVFMSESQYHAATGKISTNLQQLIEEPELHIVALSSSSPSDQLGIVPDRLDDLYELAEGVCTSHGTEVYDTLRFFIGDHPAQQFERGTQQGGTFKCGSCGCPDTRLDEFAFSSRCEWRSLADLQALVVGGKFGKRVGVLKAFSDLKVAQLREELQARGIWDIDKPKKELEKELAQSLKGAQRVPSLLITDPEQPLGSLNLSEYVILDCEPLHDLKGHLKHLLTELPHILDGEPLQLCQELLENVLLSKREGGFTGADLRVALLEVYKLLHCLDIQPEVKLLLQTAAKISEILYASEEKRTPKTILQLYNCTWMHHQLCLHLFSNPKEHTTKAIFGIYLHALVVHAPLQYEVVCLRSVNAENQERMFQQAKQIARTTTNRQPGNVVPNLLLRLQAKQLTGQLSSSLKHGETRVKRVAAALPSFPGTTVSENFINGCCGSSSWQAHLERISHYLLCGEGIWWKKVGSSFKFLDADDDADFQPQGPPLLHFRSTPLNEVQPARRKGWEKIVKEKIPFPATAIRIFDQHGNFSRFQTPEEELQPEDQPRDPSHTAGTNEIEGISFISSFEGEGKEADNAQCSIQVVTPSKRARICPITSTPVASEQAVDISGSEGETPAKRARVYPSTTPVASKQAVDISGSERETPAKQARVYPITSTPVASKQAVDISGSEGETPAKRARVYPSTTPVEDDQVFLQQNDVKGMENIAELKTKLCTAIQRAVGDSNELQSLDELHNRLKMKKALGRKLAHDEKLRHQQLVSSLQAMVLKKKSELTSTLKQLEREHFSHHNRLPVGDPNYEHLVVARNYVTKLLYKWDIML